MELTIITTIVSALAISVLAGVSFSQMRALRRQMTFSTFLKLMDDLDDELARKDREIIYRQLDTGVTDEVVRRIDTEATEKYVKYAIERTIKNLDKVGFVLLKGYGRKEEAPAWIWERALIMWQRLGPFVRYFRSQPGRTTYAIYFEELAEEAARRMKKHQL